MRWVPVRVLCAKRPAHASTRHEHLPPPEINTTVGEPSPRHSSTSLRSPPMSTSRVEELAGAALIRPDAVDSFAATNPATDATTASSPAAGRNFPDRCDRTVHPPISTSPPGHILVGRAQPEQPAGRDPDGWRDISVLTRAGAVDLREVLDAAVERIGRTNLPRLRRDHEGVDPLEAARFTVPAKV